MAPFGAARRARWVLGWSLRVRPLTIRACLVAVALTVAFALDGCGGDDASDDSQGSQGVGPSRAGSTAALAQCRHWLKGSEEERRVTIDQIRTRVNVEGQSDAPAPALSDAEAYDVIDRACSRGFTKGFRLYLIYSRAAAFESVGDTDDLIGP